MEERKEYFWAAPLIAGILTFISVFTPAFSGNVYPVQEYYWMWGLAYVSVTGYYSRTLFIPFEQPSTYTIPIFLSGIIPFIVILIGSLALLAMSYRVKRGRINAKNSANSWIAIGITMIIGTIIYIISIDITMMNYVEYQLLQIYPPPIILPNFWEVYNPNFAIIAPFIGAAICIIGAIASKVSKPREVIFPEKRDFFKPEKVVISADLTKSFRFCPNCGHQIIKEEQRFCTNCGFELKSTPMKQYP
ncbi:MAG: zinc ribbon domain-containing protein [Candidatus Thorarchaeota archaeon]